MSEEENEDKTTDSDKTGNKQKGSDFWSLWPKRTGQMTSPKLKRSRKLFTKSVFISESDKVAVTVAQMSKSIDGSLNETTAPHDLPKIVVTPAKRDRSQEHLGSLHLLNFCSAWPFHLHLLQRMFMIKLGKVM